MIFHRLLPDGFKRDADGFVGLCSGIHDQPLVILLGGPSATWDSVEKIVFTKKLANLSVNCGHRPVGINPHLFPTYWTGYDNPVRFDQSVFLDPRTIKFCPSTRANELLRDGTTLLSECPSVVFFDPQKRASNGELFTLGPVIDTRDSMLQAIDIAVKLGYRDIYLHGADLYTPLSDEQVEFINRKLTETGANLPFELACMVNSSMEALSSIAHALTCKDTPPAEMSDEQKAACEDCLDGLIASLSCLGSPDMYSMGNANTKLKDNLRSDYHYRVTSGRLIGARRNLANLGVRVSLLRGTTGCKSRLNGYFPVVRLDEIADTEYHSSCEPDYQAVGMYRRVDGGIA